jgi:hypothetical protein
MNTSKDKFSLATRGVLLVLLPILSGCPSGGERPLDRQKNEVLVEHVQLYLRNCWSWFIPPWPPVWEGGNGSLRNQSGAFPWADRNLAQTRDDCNSRIYYATKTNQTNWSQYHDPPIDDRAGWPDTIGGDPTHKAGFVCYAFVAQAMYTAGYDLDPNTVPSSDWFLRYSVVTGSVRVGDIVLYDFDRDGSYDHVGIIVDVSAGNQDYYMVVSSIGIVEHFSYGAAEKRLGVFGSAATGGDFTTWNPQWEPINKRIVRPE